MAKKSEKRREGEKRRYKRWLAKHPEITIKRLERWVSVEKDPVKLARAKELLEEHLTKLRV